MLLSITWTESIITRHDDVLVEQTLHGSKRLGPSFRDEIAILGSEQQSQNGRATSNRQSSLYLSML